MKNPKCSPTCICPTCTAYDQGVKHGIRYAAEVASRYDKLSSHDHLVSECILGKLNVLKRRPRKNTMRVVSGCCFAGVGSACPIHEKR